ncbi:MAG: hypothetical protein JWM53_4956, partial [bacterium]|nr:hypothetical protein [bacterium]
MGLENLAIYTDGPGETTISLFDEKNTLLDSFSHAVVAPTSVQLDTQPTPTVLRGSIVHVRAAPDDCIGWFSVRADAVGAVEVPEYERNDSTDFAFVVSAPSAKLDFTADGVRTELPVSSVSLDDLTSIELHSAGNRYYQLVLGNVYAGTTPVAGALCNWSTSDGDQQTAPSPVEVWLADGPQVAW